SWASTVSSLRNNTTRMARPIADSAAATVMMKKTNTCPAASPRKCEKAMKLMLTASSISSIDISITMTLRRFRKIPTTDRANRIAASARKWARLNVIWRSEEHTSELQSRENLICLLLLVKQEII